MAGIDWTAFNWESFATILTGVLAVGGATFVGRRQLGITSRQNDILASQAKLSELSFRHDVFERRYGVYADVRNFLIFIVQNAAYPNRELERDSDLEIKFFQAIGLSRFYFGDGVRDQLDAIRRRCADFAILKHKMDRLFALEQHYGPGNPEKEHDLLVWINDQLQGLPDLFGDALRLGN